MNAISNPVAPNVTLRRLAIDSSVQGKGLGALMTTHAMKIVSEAANVVGIYGLFVDTLNENAKYFYQGFPVN